MKTLLVIALALITNFVNAQNFTTYVDDTQSNGSGFAYNVTIRLSLLRMAEKGTHNKAYNGTEYSVELIKVEIDKNKGWYERGEIYKCEQLEGICNTKTFTGIHLSLSYNCQGKEVETNTATFYNIGDKQTMDLQPKSVGGSGCNSPIASGIGYIKVNDYETGNAIRSLIQKLKNGKVSTGQEISKSNPVVNETNPNTGNQTENTTAKPLDNYDPNTGLYTNPMTNTNNGSSSVDNFNKGYTQGQQIVDAATPLVQSLADIWNRKIEKENAFRENSALMHKNKENDYTNFCYETNKMIFNWPYFKENVIQRLPLLLENESPSWASILGTDDFSSAFGKDASFIMENFKPIDKSKKDVLSVINLNIINPVETSNAFWDFYAVEFDAYIKYKYNYYSNTEKLLNRRQDIEFIYNENKLVIGIILETASSYDIRVRPLDYYKDIISKIGLNYVMLDANTFLLKDKLIFFKYDAIHMYDLNYMGNQLYYNLSNLKRANPSSDPAHNFIYKNFGIMFNETFKMDQINIKWKPTSYQSLEEMKKNNYYKSNITNNQFVIEIIDKDGICGTAGLMKGDIIKKVNNISTPNPFFFRLVTYAYRASSNMNITY
jgi:hypothetical protein